MAESFNYLENMNIPLGFHPLPQTVCPLATPVFKIFGERGNNLEKYTMDDLSQLIRDCAAVLNELKRIFPKHQEIEYFEGVRRFAAEACMEKVFIHK